MQKWLIKRAWEDYLSRVHERLNSLRFRHINLFFAMVFSLMGAVVIAIVAALLLAPMLNVGTQTTPPADLTRLALTIAAGVGGVVALVVAYRRQRDLEQGRFVEAFGAAAQQLGDVDVAVRLAGVYAMAGVADQASKLKRQQCIDVLCGYLGLPYSPELGNNHQSALLVKKPALRKGGSEQELQFQYRQNDKVVRQTIVRVIVAHLQKKAPQSWSSNDFDFTGSHFELASFDGATFNGASTKFDGATFNGDSTKFNKVTFSGGSTTFEGAIFSSGVTSFKGATFDGVSTSFKGATFNGGTTSFGGATFSGLSIMFLGATFSSDSTTFDGATFSGLSTLFLSTTFNGEATTFVAATFSGVSTTFKGATFSSGVTSFKGATFDGMTTSFKSVTFSGGTTSFAGVTFHGKGTSFNGSTFDGKDTSFNGATFDGKDTSFRKVDFGVGKVSFEHPKAWSPAPVFDWEAENDAVTLKPANVEPEEWPPLLER